MNTHGDTKTCTKCGGVFARTNFYRDRATKDGLRPDCKECNKRRVLKWRYENHDRVLAYMQKYNATETAHAASRRQMQRAKAIYPEKVAAREMIKSAVKHGKIVRGPCEKCGASNAHAHHHDYSKPLDVHWLCRKCHGIEHRTTPEGIAHAARKGAR